MYMCISDHTYCAPEDDHNKKGAPSGAVPFSLIIMINNSNLSEWNLKNDNI